MVPRGASFLDAVCGPGGVGGQLAALGHNVVVSTSTPHSSPRHSASIPGPTWLTVHLAERDLVKAGITGGSDVIVSAGNVMTFVNSAKRSEGLNGFTAHVGLNGRIAVRFEAGRGYAFDDFFADAAAAGLREE